MSKPTWHWDIYRGENHQLNPAISTSKCLMSCLSVSGVHGAGNSGAGHRPVDLWRIRYMVRGRECHCFSLVQDALPPRIENPRTQFLGKSQILVSQILSKFWESDSDLEVWQDAVPSHRTALRTPAAWEQGGIPTQSQVVGWMDPAPFARSSCKSWDRSHGCRKWNKASTRPRAMLRCFGVASKMLTKTWLYDWIITRRLGLKVMGILSPFKHYSVRHSYVDFLCWLQHVVKKGGTLSHHRQAKKLIEFIRMFPSNFKVSHCGDFGNRNNMKHQDNNK